MANYLKVNSQDHASSEEGFIEICQEPSCFNHPFESVPIVLPELLKCCKITVNPLLAHVLSMVEDPSVGWRERDREMVHSPGCNAPVQSRTESSGIELLLPLC